MSEAFDQMMTEYCISKLHPDPMKCLCSNWARIGDLDINKHHKTCPLFKTEEIKSDDQGEQ